MEKEMERTKRPLSRGQTPRSASAGSGVRTLEKKNKELSHATKELEEKMKNLRNKTQQQRTLPKLSKDGFLASVRSVFVKMGAKRRRVLDLVSAGMTVKEVMDIVSCSRSLVDMVKKLRKDGKSLTRSKGSGGHNKKLNDEFLMGVACEIEASPQTSMRKMAVLAGLLAVRASSAPARELPTAPRERIRKPASNVSSRLREREAEFQRQVQDRDEQITRLKERLKVVSKKLTEAKDGQVDLSKLEKNVQLENGVELQSIIKQVTKERLQLERHLQIANDSLQRNNGFDIQRFLDLETTNHHLKQQLDSLDVLQHEHKVVEIQFKEKEEACKELMNTLNFKSALCQDLESQLAQVMEKNTQLTIANSDLQKKVVELQDVSEECLTLKSTLSQVESEFDNARSEVMNLSGKVRSLENVLDEMHKAAENRREIERQHKEALEDLRQKQEEVEDEATFKQAELIDEMKRKIGHLEKEKQVQNEKHQELILEMAELKKYGPESITSDMEQPSDNLEIDEIMAKLEQDNKFLADLDKQRAEKKGESPLHRTSSAITDSGFLSQSSLNGSSNSPTSRNSNGSLHKIPGISGVDKINLLGGGVSDNLMRSKHGLSGKPRMDKDGSIEVPGKGWCFVYVARYCYDPFQHSPNESPEAELPVNSGDYILVWGEVDDDGFFDGELLDGRRGLVPSNFVEKLEGEDLEDFHQQINLDLGDCDDSVCTSVPQDLDYLSSDEAEDAPPKASTRLEHHQSFTTLTKTNLPQYASCTDLDLTEDESEGSINDSRVPAPKQLTVEAQQNKSLVVGWNPPEYPVSKIDCYQVIMDGVVQSSTRSTEKLFKAVIYGVNATLIHRVSVKTIGINRRTSHEPACTMIIGKDAPLAPTGVKPTRTTSTACTLTWIPSNSNFMHAICVNNVEVKTVKPGVFRHTIAGLHPDTVYKVTIRAKNIKASPYISGHNLKTLASSIEIRTMPKGLPDPPVDVQVDFGPRANTLLVTWLPVTINPSGTSNGAAVIGYEVHVDGHKVQDVDCATSDHAILAVDSSLVPLSKITIKTKSQDSLSAESEPRLIPEHLVPKKKAPRSPIRNTQVDSDSDDEFQNETAHNTIKFPTLNGLGPKPREMVINYSSGYPELDSDIGPSELSDIAEEPEEGLTDSDGCSTPKRRSPLYYKEPNNHKSTYNNALNKWDNDDSPSQFTAQPLITNSTTSGLTLTNGFAQSPTQPGSQFRPTIQINQEAVNNNKNLKPIMAPKTERIRIFVALFDYDPETMSPNPESAHEELPFREGQLIKIHGEKDADGFYWGETGNKKGYVPCNMVSEVQVDDEHVAEELFKEQSSAPSPKSNGHNHPAGPVSKSTRLDDRWGDIYEATPAKRKLALYDYDPHELSPNVDSEVELSFRTGELILVYGDMDDDGFFMGEINGKRGLVPSNFLTDVPSGYDPQQLMKIVAQTEVNTTNVQVHHPHHQSSKPRVLGQQKRW
eukprot:maker-scaffold560_size136926-snap-gene-0.23 protein:Tk12128 transcript:maker-scaffold560_size136926-snap-gene-0.23-mRNA-1 annotation:"rims-binding protein 2-like"